MYGLFNQKELSLEEGRLIRRQSSNRGCHCRKSSCLKKYCECYSTGRTCNEYCRCEDCKNWTQGLERKNSAKEPRKKKIKKEDSITTMLDCFI
jgi:hypothetical protein